MSDILTIIDLNAISEGNLEAMSDFFCGSDHVIPKHVNYPITYGMKEPYNPQHGG